MTNKIKIFVGAEGIEPSLRKHLFITLRYPSRSHAPLNCLMLTHQTGKTTKYIHVIAAAII